MDDEQHHVSASRVTAGRAYMLVMPIDGWLTDSSRWTQKPEKEKFPPNRLNFTGKQFVSFFKNREKGILVKKENCIWRTQHEGIRFCRREYAFQSSSPIITLNKLPAAGRRLVRRWPPSVWSGQVSMTLQRENASQLWRRLATDRQADRPENYSLAPEASNAFGR